MRHQKYSSWINIQNIPSKQIFNKIFEAFNLNSIWSVFFFQFWLTFGKKTNMLFAKVPLPKIWSSDLIKRSGWPGRWLGTKISSQWMFLVPVKGGIDSRKNPPSEKFYLDVTKSLLFLISTFCRKSLTLPATRKKQWECFTRKLGFQVCSDLHPVGNGAFGT